MSRVWTRAPMVGRERELGFVLERLEGPGCVRVTGAPGVGKTRLLEEVVGVWVGECLHVTGRSSGSLEGAIEAALRLARIDEPRATSRAREELLERHVASGDGLLVVLDDPCVEACDWFREVVDASPSARLLVASRELEWGEWCGTLELLALEREAALELARASIEADDEQLEKLVTISGGIPLALTLLAQRARRVGLARIVSDAARAASALGRDGALERAVEQTWSVLTPLERRCVAVCAEFDGAFDGADAAVVFERLAPGESSGREALEALVDQGILEPLGARLRMSSLFRLYALARHREPGARLERARRIAERAREAVERTWARGSMVGLEWWRHERDGVWSALELDGLEVEAAADLVLACHRFEAVIDAPSERLLGQTERVLGALAEDAPRALRLRAMRVTQWLVFESRVEDARAELDALEPWSDVSPLACWLASARARLALLAGETADPIACERAIEWCVREGASGLELDARILEGIVHQWSGDHERADASLVRALSVARECEDAWAMMLASALRAQLAQLSGDAERAARHYEACWVARDVASVDMPVFFAIAELLFFGFQGAWELVDVRGGVLLARIRARSMAGPELVCRCLLAWCAHQRGDEDGARGALFLARRALERTPELGRTHGVIVGLVEGAIAGESVALSDSPHLFTRMLARVIDAQGEPARVRAGLRLAAGGDWFEFDGRERKSLRRRHPARRVLLALCEAHARGEGCTHDALLSRGWPDEFISHEAALTRLRVTIHGLRELGLRDVLHTSEGGYRLDPDLVVDAELSD